MTTVAGTVPWLPFRSTWLTQPIPAERSGRLADWDRTGPAARCAAVLRAAFRGALYGPNSLAEPDVFEDRFADPLRATLAFAGSPGT